MAKKLEGKVAVITGGASGIGLASVELFLAEGARVAIGDIQDGPGSALQARYANEALYVHTDVTDDVAIEKLVNTAVHHFGKLDVFYNNAGTAGDFATMFDLTPEGFDKTLAVLTRSVLSGHKHAARQFRKQGTGGSIITTASAAASQGGWAAAAYTIAKHAVIGITRQAVAELAPFGIRSNAISPGIIITPLIAASLSVPTEDGVEFAEFLKMRLANHQPMGRVGSAKDVAECAVFLASDSSQFITGAVIPVDGGAAAVMLGSFGTEIVKAAKDFLSHRQQMRV